MTASIAIAGRDLGTLRAAVTGDVFTRGDHGYDEARRAWNLTTDERPAVVVVAGSAATGTHGVPEAGRRSARCPNHAGEIAGMTRAPQSLTQRC
jgi:hypothetical protein